ELRATAAARDRQHPLAVRVSLLHAAQLPPALSPGAVVSRRTATRARPSRAAQLLLPAPLIGPRRLASCSHQASTRYTYARIETMANKSTMIAIMYGRAFGGLT